MKNKLVKEKERYSNVLENIMDFKHIYYAPQEQMFSKKLSDKGVQERFIV